MSVGATKRHLDKVAGLGCIVCLRLEMGETACQIHHIREGRIERNDFLTIGLCRSHHTGSSFSIHMDKTRLLRQLGVASEFDLLADVLRRIA